MERWISEVQVLHLPLTAKSGKVLTVLGGVSAHPKTSLKTEWHRGAVHLSTTTKNIKLFYYQRLHQTIYFDIYCDYNFSASVTLMINVFLLDHSSSQQNCGLAINYNQKSVTNQDGNWCALTEVILLSYIICFFPPCDHILSQSSRCPHEQTPHSSLCYLPMCCLQLMMACFKVAMLQKSSSLLQEPSSLSCTSSC